MSLLPMPVITHLTLKSEHCSRNVNRLKDVAIAGKGNISRHISEISTHTAYPAGTMGRVKLLNIDVGSTFVAIPNELWKFVGFTNSNEKRVFVSLVDQLMLAWTPLVHPCGVSNTIESV